MTYREIKCRVPRKCDICNRLIGTGENYWLFKKYQYTKKYYYCKECKGKIDKSIDKQSELNSFISKKTSY